MKFQALRAAWRFWVIGILLAACGVIIARVVAPAYTGKPRAVLSGLGRLTGAAGLLVIAVGVSRRVTTDHKEES